MRAASDPLVGNRTSVRWTAPICGGLGAQIFGVMLVEYLRKLYPVGAVFADSRYFDQPPREAAPGEGLSIFAWHLDYYGLPLERYRDNPPPRPSGLLSRLGFARHICLEDGTVKRQRAIRAALRSRPDWHEFFPISPQHRAMAEEILNRDQAATAVVHLRRGDYLNVASHIVSDEAVVPVLTKLNRLGVRRFLFLSDGDISLEFFRDQVEDGISVFTLPVADILAAHAVMRLAKCLVTSNSQFSLSAALLNRGGLCLMPRTWYAEDAASLNEELACLSEWSLLGSMS